MKSWSLQQRLLLVTLLPVALLVTLVTGHVVLARFHDLDNLHDQQGRLLVGQYQLAFERLHTTSPESLRDVAAAALEETNVRSVTLLDEAGRSLVQSGPLYHRLAGHQTLALGPGQQRLETSDTVLYVQPLAFHATGQATPPLWMVLEISRNQLLIQRYESLLTIVGTSLLGLVLLALLLGHYIRRWTLPIGAMRETLAKLDANHLDKRLDSPATGDLASLQQDINRMLDVLAEEAEDMKSSMSQANEDLRETLEVMEVQNIELTLARKEAVEGNRIKSEFLANISHEIRTPLNGIMGFAKLLLKTPLSPRQLDYVHTIQKSSDSLLAIINDVLDLSKIEAGKLVLDHTPLDIEETIFEVLNMLAPLAEEKNLEQVAFIYDDVPRHLIGDPLRLKQILTNLVNNAIKFTNAGEIVVRAMLEGQTSNHTIIRISVTDTGIGLSDTARADLFRAFSQGDPSTSRKFGGTGLGLVICKHLVEQMGGEINFESTEGAGSTFWFTIKAEPDRYPHGGHPEDDLDQRRLLVAEAHPTSRQVLTGMLESCGARVEIANSSDVLFTALSSAPGFDALLVSLNILSQKPADVADTLQRLRLLHDGPMILLTRNSDSSQEQALYQNRLVAVMSKPVGPRELRQRLQQLWQEGSGQTSLLLPASTPRVRVLAVDDNAANLRLVCTLLEDLKVETATASDGLEAVALARSQTFDLIFMDIQMPGMNGLEATLKIRGHEADGRRVPVIALTAHAMANERETLLKSGLDDYVTKPIQETQLIHILSKWTSYRPVPAHPATAPVQAPVITRATAHPPVESRPGVLDWQESLQLAAGKEDLARDMLAMLLDSLDGERQKIREAFKAADLSVLLARVHYLHGATRYCGVPGLRHAAHALETRLKTLSQENPDSGTADCQAAYDKLLACMDELQQWQQADAAL